jgi:outer membrane protein TolC
VNPSWGWFRQLNVDNPMEIETQSVQYYGNFNLRYNLFNNWKTKRAYDVAKIQEEITVINTRQVEETLETTLRNLLAMYQVRTRLVDISQENLTYATKAYDLAKARFDMGTLTSIELETFRNNYQNTLMQHFENQFNKMDTFLEIYKMTGKLGLEYQ